MYNRRAIDHYLRFLNNRCVYNCLYDRCVFKRVFGGGVAMFRLRLQILPPMSQVPPESPGRRRAHPMAMVSGWVERVFFFICLPCFMSSSEKDVYCNLFILDSLKFKCAIVCFWFCLGMTQVLFHLSCFYMVLWHFEECGLSLCHIGSRSWLFRF